MKRPIIIRFLITFASLFLCQSGVAAEPSAQEIIEKAKAVMNETMKYQVGATANATTIVVYQKVLTSGTTVSRCETSSGSTKYTYLFLSNGTFQMFPGAHAAIDVSFLEKGGQVPSVNPFSKVSADTGELKGFVAYDNKVCYKVQARSLPMETNLIAMFPPNTLIPDACQYLIETNTYRVLQMTMLHGESTYASVQFKDFGLLPNLPGDFFNIPPDYKIRRVASFDQYSRMAMIYLAPGPKHVPKGFALDPDTHLIVKVDPKTGAFIPLTTNMITSDAYQLGTRESQKRIRLVVILLLLISSVAFLAVIINQGRRKQSD